MEGFNLIKQLFDSRRKGLDYKRLDGRATVLHQVGENAIGLKYHNTDVAIFTPEYIEFQSGGWFTDTTKERMNEACILAGIDKRLSVSKKAWHLGESEYFDGIRIDYSGRILNPREPTPEVNLREIDEELLDINDNRLERMLEEHNPVAQKIIRKLLSKYMQKLSKAIDESTLSLDMGGGNCWYCALRTKDCKSLGEVTNDIDHLVAHLKEGYLMLPLIFNALKYREYAYPAIFIATSKNGKVVPDIETIRQHKESIMRAVRHYFESKLITRLVVKC